MTLLFGMGENGSSRPSSRRSRSRSGTRSVRLSSNKARQLAETQSDGELEGALLAGDGLNHGTEFPEFRTFLVALFGFVATILQTVQFVVDFLLADSEGGPFLSDPSEGGLGVFAG